VPLAGHINLILAEMKLILQLTSGRLDFDKIFDVLTLPLTSGGIAIVNQELTESVVVVRKGEVCKVAFEINEGNTSVLSRDELVQLADVKPLPTISSNLL